MTKYNKIIIFYIICFCLFGICFFRFYGDEININDVNCEIPMLWLHAASTQEKLKYASESNYCGVEIDITLSPNRGLIASYNNPNDSNAPTLNDLISNNSKIKYWWLDFKNLNFSNAYSSSYLIESLSSKYTENIFFVESHNFIGLMFLNLKLENVYKTYWLAKGPNRNNQFHWSTPLYYLRSFLSNIIIDPDFVSMFHYQISKQDFIWVGKRKRFAFTVNSFEEYEKISDAGVSVILTDQLEVFN